MHDEKRREHRKRNNDRLSEGWRELEKSARARAHERGRETEKEREGSKRKKKEIKMRKREKAILMAKERTLENDENYRKEDRRKG